VSATGEKLLRPAGVPASWEPVDMRPVLSGEVVVEEPRYLRRTDGRALLYRGRVNDLHSATETGKSWLAIAACAEAITAGERVLYIDFESDALEIGARFLALGITDVSKLDYVRPDEPITDEVARSLADPAYAFVVQDGVTEALSMLGLKSVSDVDVAAFHRRLPRPFADAGSCVLLIDHVGKATGGDNRFAIGSQHKLSGVTGAAYELQTVRPFGRGTVGEARVLLSKDRPGFVRGWARGARVVSRVRLDATGDRLELTLHAPDAGGDRGGLRPSEERVLSALRGSDEPTSPAEVVAATGLARETVQRGLRRLFDLHLVDGVDGLWWGT
jgi:hypothetical protein